MDDLLNRKGDENVRALQRAVRNIMTKYAGVIRDEEGLTKGLEELDEVEARVAGLGVHPDLAGFQDLANAYDLLSTIIAARATLQCALERRETRGCHNRTDYPETDPALQVNLVWSLDGTVEKEPIPEVPAEIAALMHEHTDYTGKLVE